MLIPSNGRIVIVDDKLEQALPLFTTLSKDKIPFTYHSEDPSQLPSTPYDNIRLLFLDINLTDGVNEHAIASQLQSTLKRLVKENSTYILAVWSIRENEYEELLTDLFNNRLPKLRPLVKISLSKSELFTINVDTGIYEPDPSIDLVFEINKRLNKELAKVDSLKVMIEFENLVNNCSCSVVTDFSNIVEKDEYWSDNIKHIFFKMAHAQLGKNILKATEKQILQAALKTLITTLIEKIETAVYNEPLNELKIDLKQKGVNFFKNVEERIVKLKWEDVNTNVIFIDNIEKGRNKIVEKLNGSNAADTNTIDIFKDFYKTTSPKLNTELLITFQKISEVYPGNIYLKKVSGLKKRNLLKTYFKGIEKKNAGIYVHKDISSIFFVELECTPVCDYSQTKCLRSRLLPGILYPQEFQSLLNQDNDSLYKEIPYFYYLKTSYKLAFDYRLLKSINLKDDSLLQNKFLFKLKTEVLIDIQARVASHINRPGITIVL